MPATSGLKIFLIAGEVSGDRLGATLMRALRQRAPDIEFAGVGGDHMAGQGLSTLFPLDRTAIIGFAAIPRRFFSLLRHIREAADAAIAARPDALVIIDSPEFTHRVARRVRRLAPQIPIINYVSPSVWAWRPGRAPAMRAYVDRILALLPFEPAAHERLGGPACSYVGHPLTERISALRPSEDEKRRRQSDPPILLVLPGSRRGELDHMLGVFERVVDLVVPKAGPFEVVIPTVQALGPLLRERVRGWRTKPRVIDDPALKDAALRTARAALVKSGTSTLELALAGVPMVAAYRLGAAEAFILKRMIKSPSVILANLVLGKKIVPEFLQDEATAERLADALLPLIGDTPAREAQLSAFARLDEIMEIGKLTPSERAAQIVLDLAAARSA